MGTVSHRLRDPTVRKAAIYGDLNPVASRAEFLYRYGNPDIFPLLVAPVVR